MTASNQSQTTTSPQKAPKQRIVVMDEAAEQKNAAAVVAELTNVVTPAVRALQYERCSMSTAA